MSSFKLKCKSCGYELESNFLYCPKCGNITNKYPDYPNNTVNQAEAKLIKKSLGVKVQLIIACILLLLGAWQIIFNIDGIGLGVILTIVALILVNAGDDDFKNNFKFILTKILPIVIAIGLLLWFILFSVGIEINPYTHNIKFNSEPSNRQHELSDDRSESIDSDNSNYIHNKYVASRASDKYHLPSCRYVDQIKQENLIYFDSLSEILSKYEPCSVCDP